MSLERKAAEMMLGALSTDEVDLDHLAALRRSLPVRRKLDTLINEEQNNAGYPPEQQIRYPVQDRISSEVFWRLVKLQHRCCAVCCFPFGAGRQPCVDHDHETDLTRGLLCDACNRTEGWIRKSGLSPIDFARLLQLYLDTAVERIREAEFDPESLA